MDPWWTEQTAAWLGAGGGSALGVLGGAFGVTAGLLVPKGKGKPIVVGLGALMIGVGLISLIAGIVALAAAQPYHVFYPLLLIGGIATLVMGINLPVILKRYRQAEARKVSAEELRRG